MRKLQRVFFKFYLNIINSIAFYPSLIAIGFLLFSFAVMTLEYQPFMIELKEAISIMLVQGTDNARSILTTIAAGVISLMVFSFSMVMVVLNRASSTLSPRVIPGLITNKPHQIVLGVYLGTIIYSLILTVNIQSAEAKHQIPSVGIFISMLFVVVCLALFVYFIHSISRSIQVDNILEKIFYDTKEQLKAAGKIEKEEVPHTEEWHTIKTKYPGYIKQVKADSLLKFCQKHDLKVQLTEPIGTFVVKGFPFLKVNKELDKEEELDIINCFVFYAEEHVRDHYIFGFKQISEIAVKALSPGINDPGTAIKAIDMLSILYIERMIRKERICLMSDDKQPYLFFTPVSFSQLLYNHLTPIREYGKKDASVMLNLFECLKNMAFADKDNKDYTEILVKYLNGMANSCKEYITDGLDKEQVNKKIDSINSLLGNDISVENIGQ